MEQRPKSSMQPTDLDAWHMRRVLALAAQGRGTVEPNPMVGCVVAHGAEIIGEGWHRRYGGPHAEVDALSVAGRRARGATVYVNLEPCCHHGKTPPCTQAIVAADVARVVVAQQDPFPQVAGRGIAQMESAGIELVSRVCEEEATQLNSPYIKRVTRGRPWVIAKWAMSLDGKVATSRGSSRWISSEASRRIVHQIRGRVDAILVGRGTAVADDPLLTARPAGTRTATRVVVDTHGKLPLESQLVRTAREFPLLVAAGGRVETARRTALTDAGGEVFACSGSSQVERFEALLDELGRREMTNVLVEGGPTMLGRLFDAGLIDEVHVFIAPMLLGGKAAPSALAGDGIGDVSEALQLCHVEVMQLEGDVYLRGRVQTGR